MEHKTTILNSEAEFRNYVISNYQNVSQIIVFKDVLESTNYFYCFNQNGSIVATKGLGYKKFSSTKKIYKRLAKRINFSISNCSSQTFAIKLVPESVTRCI